MKICTVVGARPQFIKAAPLSKALEEAGHQELLIHTGQHYDSAMSQVFFEELGIPAPYVNLGIGSGHHGAQTGQMIQAIEEILIQERPDVCLLFGDTNSTLAGAIASCKLRIPIAHVEAGLRSYNRSMPEEHNRVLTDHASDWLFCPTAQAVENLHSEGITKGVALVGDIMFDALRQFSPVAAEKSEVIPALGLAPSRYVLCTIHRPYNTDDPFKLGAILHELANSGEEIVVPLHPRTRNQIERWGLDVAAKNLRIIDPVGYLDMLQLEGNARLVVTDSGGVQKEAFLLEKPCLTIRPETEWVETVESGWNRLVDLDKAPGTLAGLIQDFVPPPGRAPKVFGDGTAAKHITTLIEQPL